MSFIEASKIKLTTAAVVAVFVSGLIVADTAWKVNVSRDLSEIRAKQQELIWHPSDMESWISRTERMNYLSGWRGADVAP